jgi:hypothetical protein
VKEGMERHARKNKRHSERGVALVIAICTLMLISVVATALILMSGTESAMKANYKSAMHAFYDAKAGLEEGRGRLWTGNPNSVANCVFPAPGQMMPVSPTIRVCYIVNPSAGEVVNPLDLSTGNPYADLEFQQEWGTPLTGAAVQPLVNSTSPIAGANIAGPLYKWVRITPRTEFSGNIDVDASGPPLDNVNPLFFDGTQQLLSSGGNPVPNAGQVLTVTALAVTPFGSRRMVQYTISSPMSSLALNFPAALVLTGGTPDANTFQAPSSSAKNFYLDGIDRQGSDPGNCALPPQAAITAIGLTGDPAPVIANIPNGRRDHYVGTGGSPPSVANIASALPLSEQSVNGLESVALTITNSATDIVPGPATTLPNFGSMTGPVIEVVQGDLTINPATTTTGYGILLVTGSLTVGGSFGWRGIVLVIGQGSLNGNQSDSNEFDGAILVAKTRDPQGNVLGSLGTPTVVWTNGNGNGMYYDSCWINNAATASSYKVLSFREIPQ